MATESNIVGYNPTITNFPEFAKYLYPTQPAHYYRYIYPFLLLSSFNIPIFSYNLFEIFLPIFRIQLYAIGWENIRTQLVYI